MQPVLRLICLPLITLCALLCTSTALRAQFTFEMPGADATYITGINNSFHICGYAEYPDGSVKGFVKTKTDTLVIATNHYNEPSNIWLGGINDLGEVVGRYNNDFNSFTYFPFKYHYPTGASTLLSDIFGFENTSPNDINNAGWISGDLKDGVQRRIFTYHPDHGLSTNFVFIDDVVMPTYGGHHVDDNGKTTVYWIQGLKQRSGYYQDGFGFTDTLITQYDPVYPSIEKMNYKGGNAENVIVYFPQSRKTRVYWHESQGFSCELLIPGATEVWGMDINESDHIAGYYRAADGIVKGFYQANEEADFVANEDGFNLNNDETDMWSWEVQTVNDYYNDPYWYWYHDHEEIPFPDPQDGYITFTMSSWIPWKDWVRAFGESQCYHHAPNVNFTEISQPAFQSWRLFRKDAFDGAGFGFCVNALHARNNVEGYYQKYPETDNLFTLPNNVSSVDWGVTKTYCASSMRAAQAQARSESSVWAKMQPTRPLMEVLGTIYESLTGADNASMVMSLSTENQDGEWEYKSVIPTKIEVTTTDCNAYRLYYYDPNYRFDNNRYLTIFFHEDTTYIYTMENFLFPSNVKVRMEDCEPLLQNDYPQLYNLNGGSEYRESSVRMAFLNNPDIHITSPDGELIVTNQLYQNSIPGSQSLNAHGGYIEKPHVFTFLPDEYNATVTSQDDRPFSAWGTSEQGTIIFNRTAAQAGEVDHIRNIGTLFTYDNQSGSSQNLNATILTSDGDMQLTYYVDDIQVNDGQEISLEIMSPTQVMITSSNAATDYDVRIRIFNPEVGFWEASAEDIPIGTNVTQILIPSLTDDTMDGIIVETDADQDGVFEGSDAYDNTGMPNMLLSHYEVTVPNGGATETVHVSNVGGGNLNWTVISSPSWITVNTGAFGVNHGPITFTVAENTGSEGRQDYILIEAAAPSNDVDTVLVIQGEGGEVGINKLKLEDALITLSPNPAHDFLQITMDTKFLGDASYRLYNAAGQLVQENILLSNRTTLNTSKLESGIYQLQFKISGQQIIKRLVIE
jgi:hypothetical protein